MDALWKRIEDEAQSGVIDPKKAKLLLPRLHLILEDLSARHKLRYLTEESKQQMNLNQYLCDNGNKCKELKAFYVPLTHHILIDNKLVEEEKADALFHELVHAYQYTYRFPLDAETIQKAADEHRLDKKAMGEYQSYYYESQAHWYTLKLSPRPIWKAHMGDEAGAFLSTVVTLGKTAFSGLLLGVPMMLTDQSMKELLPEVDQFCYRSHSAICIYQGGGVRNTLHLSELVPMKNTPAGYVHGGENLEFHREFGRSIEKTYFGELPAVFRDNREDLKLSNELHNQYYKRIGTSSKVDSGGCAALVSKVMSSDTSPMVAWLALPSNEFESCDIYRDKSSAGYRSEFSNIYLGAVDPKSPFGILRPGGDGSRPDLSVQPITIQPQLTLVPEKTPSELGEKKERSE